MGKTRKFKKFTALMLSVVLCLGVVLFVNPFENMYATGGINQVSVNGQLNETRTNVVVPHGAAGVAHNKVVKAPSSMGEVLVGNNGRGIDFTVTFNAADPTPMANNGKASFQIQLQGANFWYGSDVIKLATTGNDTTEVIQHPGARFPEAAYKALNKIFFEDNMFALGATAVRDLQAVFVPDIIEGMTEAEVDGAYTAAITALSTAFDTATSSAYPDVKTYLDDIGDGTINSTNFTAGLNTASTTIRAALDDPEVSVASFELAMDITWPDDTNSPVDADSDLDLPAEGNLPHQVHPNLDANTRIAASAAVNTAILTGTESATVEQLKQQLVDFTNSLVPFEFVASDGLEDPALRPSEILARHNARQVGAKLLVATTLDVTQTNAPVDFAAKLAEVERAIATIELLEKVLVALPPLMEGSEETVVTPGTTTDGFAGVPAGSTGEENRGRSITYGGNFPFTMHISHVSNSITIEYNRSLAAAGKQLVIPLVMLLEDPETFAVIVPSAGNTTGYNFPTNFAVAKVKGGAEIAPISKSDIAYGSIRANLPRISVVEGAANTFSGSSSGNVNGARGLYLETVDNSYVFTHGEKAATVWFSIVGGSTSNGLSSLEKPASLVGHWVDGGSGYLELRANGIGTSSNRGSGYDIGWGVYGGQLYLYDSPYDVLDSPRVMNYSVANNTLSLSTISTGEGFNGLSSSFTYNGTPTLSDIGGGTPTNTTGSSTIMSWRDFVNSRYSDSQEEPIPQSSETFAYFSEDGDQIAVIFAANLNTVTRDDSQIATLHFEDLGISHENPNSPTFGTVLVRLADLGPTSTDIGVRGGVNTGEVQVATLEDYNISFNVVGSAPTLLSGVTELDEPILNSTNDRFLLSKLSVSGTGGEKTRAATVKLAENTVNAWSRNTFSDFQLVDGDGESLAESVKIVALIPKLSGGNNGENHFRGVAATGSQPQVDGTTWANVVQPAGRGDPVWFTDDGAGFSLLGIERNSNAVTPVSMEITLFLSARAGFTGPVYLAANQSGDAANDRVQIATFKSNIEAELEGGKYTFTSNIAQPINQPIPNIVIRETEPGLLQDGDIEMEIRSRIGMTDGLLFFQPIGRTQMAVTGDASFMVPLALNQGRDIRIPLSRESRSEAAEITLSDLRVASMMMIPSGDYDMVISGYSIADNTDELLNRWSGDRLDANNYSSGAAQTRQDTLNPRDLGYARYAFQEGLVVRDFLLHESKSDEPIELSPPPATETPAPVVTPPPTPVETAPPSPYNVQRIELNTNTMAQVMADGMQHILMADGVVTPIVNIENRNLIPLRALGDLIGAETIWLNAKNAEAAGFAGPSGILTVGGISVRVQENSATMWINGVATPMEGTAFRISPDHVIAAPTPRPETVNGRFYVPLRILEGFGWDVQWQNPTAIMTAPGGQAVSTQPVVPQEPVVTQPVTPVTPVTPDPVPVQEPSILVDANGVVIVGQFTGKSVDARIIGSWESANNSIDFRADGTGLVISSGIGTEFEWATDAGATLHVCPTPTSTDHSNHTVLTYTISGNQLLFTYSTASNTFAGVDGSATAWSKSGVDAVVETPTDGDATEANFDMTGVLTVLPAAESTDPDVTKLVTDLTTAGITADATVEGRPAFKLTEVELNTLRDNITDLTARFEFFGATGYVYNSQGEPYFMIFNVPANEVQ